MIPTYGYFRCSTEEQKTNRNIDSQIAAVERYAKDNSFELVEKFCDDGISGSILERYGLDNLRNKLKESSVKHLLIYQPDRLSRVQLHQLLLLSEFEKLGVKVIFITLPDMNDLPEEAQIINRSVQAMFSQLELLRIRDRTRRGRIYKVNQGNICTSRSTYGFNYIKEDKDRKIPGHFVHNPQEIEIVKMILSWAIEGWSQRKIIQELFKRKISTRNGKITWAKSTISKIIGVNLSVYYGEWFYLKYQQVEAKNPINKNRYKKSEKSSRILRDKSEWLKVQLPPELAIITKEQAAIIRQKQLQNRVFSDGNRKNFYLLGKMVYCKFCNQPDYSDSFHGKGYYRCADRKRQFPNPPKCQGGSIKAETLDDIVWDSIKNAMSNPQVLAPQVSKFIETQKDDGVIRDSGLIENQKQRQQLEKERERTIEAYRQEAITLEELKEQRVMFEIKHNQLDRQEQEVIANRKKAGVMNMEFLNNQIEIICREFKKELGLLTDQEKRQILQWLSLKIFTGDYQYDLEFKLPIPVDAKHWALHSIKRSTRSG